MFFRAESRIAFGQLARVRGDVEARCGKRIDPA